MSLMSSMTSRSSHLSIVIPAKESFQENPASPILDTPPPPDSSTPILMATDLMDHVYPDTFALLD